jgi:hypothetical protein
MCFLPFQQCIKLHTVVKIGEFSSFHVEKPTALLSFQNVKDQRKKREMQGLENI